MTSAVAVNACIAAVVQVVSPYFVRSSSSNSSSSSSSLIIGSLGITLLLHN